MSQVFEGGVAYVMGQVEAEKDWDKSSNAKFVQKVDQVTGLRVWSVVIVDPGSASQRKIKILCDDEPVVPEPAAGCRRSCRWSSSVCRCGRGWTTGVQAG